MRRRLALILSTASTAAAVLFLAPLHAATARPVTFRTDDGVTIAASFYEAARHPAPAVILLHMQTRTRDDWQATANRLADAGINALAIDFRGHGGSGAGAPGATGGAGGDAQPDLARLVLDVRAARGFLTSRPDLVRPGDVGIAGASLGASIAVLEAADDPAIRSLALLSPSLDYRSLRIEAPMKKYGARPALLIAASNDPYALRSVKDLAALRAGAWETRTVENGGHGTTMLVKDPELVSALVDWFLRTLI